VDDRPNPPPKVISWSRPLPQYTTGPPSVWSMLGRLSWFALRDPFFLFIADAGTHPVPDAPFIRLMVPLLFFIHSFFPTPPGPRDWFSPPPTQVPPPHHGRTPFSVALGPCFFLHLEPHPGPEWPTLRGFLNFRGPFGFPRGWGPPMNFFRPHVCPKINFPCFQTKRPDFSHFDLQGPLCHAPVSISPDVLVLKKFSEIGFTKAPWSFSGSPSFLLCAPTFPARVQIGPLFTFLGNMVPP